MKKRVFSLLLALTALLCVLPASAANQYDTDRFQNYNSWSTPIYSHLYADESGGVTRVEYAGESVLVEEYTAELELRASREIPMERPLWGGFFAGEDYLFVICGQNNLEENDETEVVRVIRYDRDWNRLDHASIYGANTIRPFAYGSLRCVEYNGYLYVHTCHQMYAADDGLNHQANMSFSVRISDMEAYYYTYLAYTSHSFNQFVLVDEQGQLVTLDHGDAYPRALILHHFDKNLTDSPWSFSSRTGTVHLVDFPGQIGDNVTGASVGGFAETASGYAAVYNDDGQGGRGDRYPYFHFVGKDLTDHGAQKLSGTPCDTPVLAPTGLEGGYVLWNDEMTSTLHYVTYDTQGNLGQTQTVDKAWLSDCQPIPFDDGVLWYVVQVGDVVFYHLNEDGLTRKVIHSPVPAPEKAPTCTATGLTGGVVCENCGELLEPRQEVPMLPHTEEIIPGWAARCESNGMTDGKRCTVCGTTTLEREVIPALGHDPQVIPAVAPTCTATGLTEGSKCARCGRILVRQQLVPTVEHRAVPVPGKDPTCTEDGLTPGEECGDCGRTIVWQLTIPRLGHEYEVDSGKSPTCTEDGLTHKTWCTRCGYVQQEQKVIPAKGHDPVTLPAVPPTRLGEGLTEGSKCSVCGVILRAQEKVAKLPEAELTGVETQGDAAAAAARGEPIPIVVEGIGGNDVTILAALYDGDGRMLAVRTLFLPFPGSREVTVTADLTFTPCEQAVTLRVMLVKGLKNMTPMDECLSFYKGVTA